MRVFILLMALLLMAVPVMSHVAVATSETQIIMVGGVLLAAGSIESAVIYNQPVLATQVLAQVNQRIEQKRTIPMIGVEADALDAYDIYRRTPRRTAISRAGSLDL